MSVHTLLHTNGPRAPRADRLNVSEVLQWWRHRSCQHTDFEASEARGRDSRTTQKLDCSRGFQKTCKTLQRSLALIDFVWGGVHLIITHPQRVSKIQRTKPSQIPFRVRLFRVVRLGKLTRFAVFLRDTCETQVRKVVLLLTKAPKSQHCVCYD